MPTEKKPKELFGLDDHAFCDTAQFLVDKKTALPSEQIGWQDFDVDIKHQHTIYIQMKNPITSPFNIVCAVM